MFNIKRSKFITGASVVLAASVMSGIFIPSSAAELSDAKVQSYENQLGEISAKQEEALKNIEATKNDIEKTKQYKASLDQSLDLTYQKKMTAENMLSELEEKIEEKNEQIEKSEEEIKDKSEKFKERMTFLYEEGNASYLSLILGAEDISSLLSTIDNVVSILEYDNQVMADLRRAKQELATAVDELEAAKETQAAAIEELENTEAYYKELSAQNAALIESLQKSEGELQADYNYYVNAEDKLNSELEAYLQELKQKTIDEENRKNPPTGDNSGGNTQSPAPSAGPVYGGDYIWPLSGYTSISSSFGGRNLNGQNEYHYAVDIPAPTGTPIYASKGGEVLRSEYHDSYGNYVLINHGDNRATLYAHMTTRLVSAGTTVSQGDTIGLVGETGRAFGSHLHFELRVDGVRTDPMILFQ